MISFDEDILPPGAYTGFFKDGCGREAPKKNFSHPGAELLRTHPFRTKTMSVCKFFVKTRVCLLSIGHENCDILFSPPHVAGHPPHRNVEYIHINSINLLILVTYI